ncbi:hypothetical protein BOTBODRAFT_192159 [Botryobasidium botryosum FD-172 SS1]|uniref:Uncharacterized protein n=1 Tax=Botryobasidium botryosum (strain FD-172 SS1) TaxID=930990 RepID=A0A067M7H3_BOTB1|nr:hypothetical protein BOTBODRAFT_192159 [Botryobasidium botryosum FD-172 SS1]
MTDGVARRGWTLLEHQHNYRYLQAAPGHLVDDPSGVLLRETLAPRLEVRGAKSLWSKFVFRDDQGKPDSALSAADRGKVAMDQQKTYENDAIERLKKLKEDYGNGVSTLVRVYNASGDRITLQDEHSWRGSFYGGPPESFIENGQWGVFLHVKPTGAAVGSAGAVVYRTAGSADIFWDTGSKDAMLALLDDKAGPTFRDSNAGYKVYGNIETSTTSHYQVIIEKN